MIWPVFIVAMSSLACVGGILALALAFKTHMEAGSHETDADRAYRWREQMRAKSHERWRR